MSDTQIKWRIRAGQWMRVSRGVYRHKSMPHTQLARVLAACLACKALASHRSAAALHNIDGFSLDRIELVVPRGGARSVRGAILHQSTQFDLAKPVERQGVPCTELGRTLLDVRPSLVGHAWIKPSMRCCETGGSVPRIYSACWCLTLAVDGMAAPRSGLRSRIAG